MGAAVIDMERGQFADARPFYWQTDTAVALNSWCYTRNNQYKQADELICDLVDIVSKNGNLLLNIGPRADGTIPEEDAGILREIGRWLSVNGEAIYDTHVWKKYGEGPVQVTEGPFSDKMKKNYTSQDVRYTAKGRRLYAIAMKPSADGTYCFNALGGLNASGGARYLGKLCSVEPLGFPAPCEWKQDEGGLHVKTEGVTGNKPVVFRIGID